MNKLMKDEKALEEHLTNLFKNHRKVSRKEVIYFNLALRLAKEAHQNTFRNTKEPYFCHPLRTAILLAGLEFEAELIIAAILHDILRWGENVSLQHLLDNFSEKIGKLILQTTNWSIEDNYLKDNIEVGYILLASRLDNLETMEGENYPLEKKLEKIQQTEKIFLGTATLDNSEFFVRNFQNAFFRIKNEEAYTEIRNVQNTLIKNYAESISHTEELFLEILNKEFLHNDCNLKIDSIDFSKTLPSEINKYNKHFAPKMEKLPKKSCPVIDVTLIFSSNVLSTKENLLTTTASFFLLIFNKLFLNNYRKYTIVDICEFADDPTERPYYILEDYNGLRYRIILHEQHSYKLRQYGLKKNIETFEIKESLKHHSNLIKVYTRKNEKRFIKRDATLHDFAFSIHESLGLEATNAKVTVGNEQKLVSLDSQLIPGSKIEILRKPKTIPELSWFEYLQTPIAKQTLINYFNKNITTTKNIRAYYKKQNELLFLAPFLDIWGIF